MNTSMNLAKENKTDQKQVEQMFRSIFRHICQRNTTKKGESRYMCIDLELQFPGLVIKQEILYKMLGRTLKHQASTFQKAKYKNKLKTEHRLAAKLVARFEMRRSTPSNKDRLAEVHGYLEKKKMNLEKCTLGGSRLAESELGWSKFARKQTCGWANLQDANLQLSRLALTQTCREQTLQGCQTSAGGKLTGELDLRGAILIRCFSIPKRYLST